MRLESEAERELIKRINYGCINFGYAWTGIFRLNRNKAYDSSLHPKIEGCDCAA